MRWPLRNQILVRMLLLVAITILVTTFASIRSTINANRQSEQKRLDDVANLLRESRFPLTNTVLDQMKALSQAEFVRTDAQEKIIAQTSAAPAGINEFLEDSASHVVEQAELVMLEDQSYYHIAINTGMNIDRQYRQGLLHIFLPRKSDSAVWASASKQPLLVAALILPVTILIGLALASQVTRPLSQLERQVRVIANGDIHEIEAVKGNNEVRDLNESINEMATKLGDHDAQLITNERLRSMVQFGSSVAHHLRNSATGCKMALELLAVENSQVAQSENYSVAIRQLDLMNEFIRKFLQYSKSPDEGDTSDTPLIDLEKVLDNVVFLVRPSAKHLSVDLDVLADCDESRIKMRQDDAQHLIMNLVTNAITAASQANLMSAEGSDSHRGRVSIKLAIQDGNVSLDVSDNGNGPPAEIADNIFQPFITGSAEGMGLGLPLAAQIAEAAGGEINWIRQNDITTFAFNLQHDGTFPGTES